MRRFTLCLLGILALVGACSEGSGSSGLPGGDTNLREVGDTAPSSDGGRDQSGDVPSDEGAAGDVPSDEGAAGDVSGADGSAPDVGADDLASSVPGPDNPTVGCLSDIDCGEIDGETGVCCTSSASYLSECVAASRCSGGAHDACLTDAQCPPRRPGQWTVCCHDRGQRDFCAPLIETCQPLVPCAGYSDCAGQTFDTCCSPHPYYQASYCTSSFFAVNPTSDCPP